MAGRRWRGCTSFTFVRARGNIGGRCGCGCRVYMMDCGSHQAFELGPEVKVGDEMVVQQKERRYSVGRLMCIFATAIFFFLFFLQKWGGNSPEQTDMFDKIKRAFLLGVGRYPTPHLAHDRLRSDGPKIPPSCPSSFRLPVPFHSSTLSAFLVLL